MATKKYVFRVVIAYDSDCRITSIYYRHSVLTNEMDIKVYEELLNTKGNVIGDADDLKAITKEVIDERALLQSFVDYIHEHKVRKLSTDFPSIYTKFLAKRSKHHNITLDIDYIDHIKWAKRA